MYSTRAGGQNVSQIHHHSKTTSFIVEAYSNAKYRWFYRSAMAFSILLLSIWVHKPISITCIQFVTIRKKDEIHAQVCIEGRREFLHAKNDDAIRGSKEAPYREVPFC